MASTSLWQRFQEYFLLYEDLDISIDISRARFSDDCFENMRPDNEHAFTAMDELEAGAIANPDENRMVGHYWLRAPELAPTPEITFAIRDTIAGIKVFSTWVHRGDIKPPKAAKFTQVLSIGIGGSALGPEFVHDALGASGEK